METETKLPRAPLIVHTPNGPVASCADHAEKLVSLMRFLGAHAASVPNDGDEQCANCINEAKRKKW
jgi:hypothetical protein